MELVELNGRVFQGKEITIETIKENDYTVERGYFFERGGIAVCWKYCKKNILLVKKKEGGCLNCVSHNVNVDGYPKVSFNNITYRLSHFIFSLYHNIAIEEIKGKLLLHSCDNRTCVNPEHLHLGTHDENMQEMKDRNRQAKGEKVSTAKLTVENVRMMREDGFVKPDECYADLFGVKKSTIKLVRECKLWKHVQ
jgi:hypothetical protein